MISSSDIKYKKSTVVSDAATNGGAISTNDVVFGLRNGLFPRVTAAEKTAGITRYRKLFLQNDNTTDTAANLLAWLMVPSVGGSSIGLALGTNSDTQSLATGYSYVGVGQLETALSAGATTVRLTMETTGFAFPAGASLRLSNKCKVAQTVADGIQPGECVTYSAGTWSRSATSADITYPLGIYAGGGVVLTDDGTGTEEFPAIASVSWLGSVAIVSLAAPVENAYATANTFGGACVTVGNILPDGAHKALWLREAVPAGSAAGMDLFPVAWRAE